MHSGSTGQNGAVCPAEPLELRPHMYQHGKLKFPNASLTLTSANRGWCGIAAELRRHPAGELPPFTPAQMEVTLAVKDARDSKVGRRGGGIWQDTPARAGTLWLCPIGVHEDAIRITNEIPEVLHIYLPAEQFTSLSENWDRPISPDSIRYLADLEDSLVRQIALSILHELQAETASGRVLVEALSLGLVAHLAHSYSGPGRTLPGRDRAEGLDGVRLRRVLDYIADNLNGDLSISELAATACLSRYHFARAFQRATGLPPHRYVSSERLKLARRLLADTNESLVQVALACKFSSQANFTRAFRQALGVSPGQFRQTMQG